jgi:hypothetical protein
MPHRGHPDSGSAYALGAGAAPLLLYIVVTLLGTTMARAVTVLLNVGSLIGLATAPCLSLYLTFRSTRPWFAAGSGYWQRAGAAAVGSLVFSLGLSIAGGTALISLVYLERAWWLFGS